MKNWQKLVQNDALWHKYFVREKIIKSIRQFFYTQGFHEVETPLLMSSVIPESYLEYFETFLFTRRKKKRKMFLATSPEASLKKLIAAGIGNCFEITKSFRNTETDGKLHNPEFTILEYYRIHATYEDIMHDCEELFLYILKSLVPTNTSCNLTFQNKIIDLSSPWEKITVSEAMEKYAQISFDEIAEIDKKGKAEFLLKRLSFLASKKGYTVDHSNTWEELFNQIFLNEVEPHLGTRGKPTIIYDYPKPMAALAKLKNDDSRIAERFEVYISGLELGDCYSELIQASEQTKRFRQEQQIRKIKRKSLVKTDSDFLQALEIGLPPCSGIAIGIDRLVMLFTDSSSIADVLLFPIIDMMSD